MGRVGSKMGGTPPAVTYGPVRARDHERLKLAASGLYRRSTASSSRRQIQRAAEPTPDQGYPIRVPA